MNPVLYIDIGDYQFRAVFDSGKIFVPYIKKTRQRKYRSLGDFYNEEKGIKENQIDRMLNMVGRYNRSGGEKFKEQEEQLKELGIRKEEIIEAYRREYIDYVKNFNFE